MKRGRKPASGLSVVATFSGNRIEPPPHLNKAQAAEWHDIVNSLPADYFRPGDIPLLAAFCAASAFYKQAQKLLEDEGLILLNERGNAQAHPASQILTAQASSMAQMAVKLRLCPSARYSERKAGAAEAKTTGRPWENAAQG